MQLLRLHDWDVTPGEARVIQESLRDRVVRQPTRSAFDSVAGVDVNVRPADGVTVAAVVVLALPGLEVRAQAVAERPTHFPYVPGLLSFREIPAVADALARLDAEPDVFVCDGHGLAHPRRFGLACHLGLLTGRPSIGVAKTLLVGEHQPVGPHRGDRQPLVHRGEVVGAALRTRAGVKPVYVSIGHMVDLDTAVDVVLRCSPRYRLPETTRAAHALAGDWNTPLAPTTAPLSGASRTDPATAAGPGPPARAQAGEWRTATYRPGEPATS